MRAGMTLAIFAGVLVAQIGQDDPPGAIRGTVKDSAGLPVSGITVEALPGTEPRTMFVGGGNVLRIVSGGTATTLTDEAGKYTLKSLAPGTHLVRTERDPDSSAYRRVKVNSGQESILDMMVPSNSVISGHVLDGNNDPVTGAYVWLLKTEYQGGVLRQVVSGPKVTKKDGEYLYDFGLESNRRYYILVDRPVPKDLQAGQAADLEDRQAIEVPTYYPSATRIDLASPVVLQPGEQREKVDIKVATAPFYCIDGTIAGGGHFTIQDSQVTGTSLTRVRGDSGDDGKYRVCGLPAGQYQLSGQQAATEFTVFSSDLHRVDPSSDPAHLHIQLDWAVPPAPKLDPASETAVRKFAGALGLDDTADVSGLQDLISRLAHGDAATDDDIESLAARLGQSRDYTAGKLAGVSAFLPSPFLVHITLHGGPSNRHIPFALAVPYDSLLANGIPPGDYAVEFETFGRTVAYPKEIIFNGVKLTDGILRFAPESSNTLHVVMATDVATITVTVADIDGKPVPNATVMLIPDSVTTPSMLSRISSRGRTDQNGSYTSPPLAPGKYRVLATTQTVRWSAPGDLERVLLSQFHAKDVDVAPNATLQVSVEPIVIY